MIITWDLETGYVDGIPSFEVEVCDKEIADCDTIEDLANLFEDMIYEDFQDKIKFNSDYLNPSILRKIFETRKDLVEENNG